MGLRVDGVARVVIGLLCVIAVSPVAATEQFRGMEFDVPEGWARQPDGEGFAVLASPAWQDDRVTVQLWVSPTPIAGELRAWFDQWKANQDPEFGSVVNDDVAAFVTTHGNNALRATGWTDDFFLNVKELRLFFVQVGGQVRLIRASARKAATLDHFGSQIEKLVSEASYREAGLGGPEPVAPRPSQPAPAAGTLEFHGMEFELPEGWRVEDRTDSELRLVSGHVLVTMNAPTPLEGELRAALEARIAHYTWHKDIVSFRTHRDNPGVRTRAFLSFGAYPLNLEVFVVQAGGQARTIIGSSYELEQLDRFLPALAKVVDEAVYREQQAVEPEPTIQPVATGRAHEYQGMAYDLPAGWRHGNVDGEVLEDRLVSPVWEDEEVTIRLGSPMALAGDRDLKGWFLDQLRERYEEYQEEVTSYQTRSGNQAVRASAWDTENEGLIDEYFVGVEVFAVRSGGQVRMITAWSESGRASEHFMPQILELVDGSVYREVALSQPRPSPVPEAPEPVVLKPGSLPERVADLVFYAPDPDIWAREVHVGHVSFVRQGLATGEFVGMAVVPGRDVGDSFTDWLESSTDSLLLLETKVSAQSGQVTETVAGGQMLTRLVLSTNFEGAQRRHEFVAERRGGRAALIQVTASSTELYERYAAEVEAWLANVTWTPDAATAAGRTRFGDMTLVLPPGWSLLQPSNEPAILVPRNGVNSHLGDGVAIQIVHVMNEIRDVAAWVKDLVEQEAAQLRDPKKVLDSVSMETSQGYSVTMQGYTGLMPPVDFMRLVGDEKLALLIAVQSGTRTQLLKLTTPSEWQFLRVFDDCLPGIIDSIVFDAPG